MRFFSFIESSHEEILKEWDSFAKTLFPKHVERYLRRDHAAEMLTAISTDMQTAQSGQEQIDKSKGIVSPYRTPNKAASVHGVTRSIDGLTVSQLASEFRALRAVILRLWLPTNKVMSVEVINDIIRFNEAIDEAVADSISTHSDDRLKAFQLSL